MRERKLTSYQQKLLNPLWQKKRLEILQRDEWRCQRCDRADKTLHVHHRVYYESDPWNIPNTALETLCDECHEQESAEGKTSEKDFISTLRIIGMPWFAFDVLTHELRKCFPPLRTQDALAIAATLKKLLPSISKGMGLIASEGQVSHDTYIVPIQDIEHICLYANDPDNPEIGLTLICLARLAYDFMDAKGKCGFSLSFDDLSAMTRLKKETILGHIFRLLETPVFNLEWDASCPEFSYILDMKMLNDIEPWELWGGPGLAS